MQVTRGLRTRLVLLTVSLLVRKTKRGDREAVHTQHREAPSAVTTVTKAATSDQNHPKETLCLSRCETLAALAARRVGWLRPFFQRILLL